MRIVEKENGVTARDAQFIWIGTRIAEERLRTGEIARFSKTPRSMMVPTAT